MESYIDNGFVLSDDNINDYINIDNSISNNNNNNSNSNNNSSSNSNSSSDRKRRRNNRNDNDDSNTITDINLNDNNNNLFQMKLDHDEEIELAKSIFEIGLKNSSPKVLIALMPFYPNLNTEHIKSHLQKYRIHYNKSKDEFIQYYLNNIKNPYIDWVDAKEDRILEDNTNTKESPIKNASIIEVSDNDLTSDLASDIGHTSNDVLSSLSDKADNIINEYHKLFTSVINDNERIHTLLQISALNAEVDSIASKR